MCLKFRAGACRNGENFNFAHCIEDLRQAPPNWQELVGGNNEEKERSPLSTDVGISTWHEDEKIILRMRLCRKFYLGEDCPYGDKCTFFHEDPTKFRVLESSVISIGTTNNVPQMTSANASNNQVEVNLSAPPGNNGAGNTVHWKTRMCTNLEATGYPFGQPDMQNTVGRPEGEAVMTKAQALPNVDVSAVKPVAVTTAQFVDEEQPVKKTLFKWPKKMNRIYGDWNDDLPLEQNSPNQKDSKFCIIPFPML